MLAGLGQLRGNAEELRSAGTWSKIEANFFGFGEAEELFEGRGHSERDPWVWHSRSFTG